jgi:Mg-chelatase subunit ChlD
MHGLLPERSIVYVLDASGSMGEWGKFARARLTLLATLRQQPSTTRFQIVVYNSTARVLVPSNGGCLPVSEASTRQAEAELAKVAPVGKSEHLRGFQTALNLRSDYIVIVTDADDLPAAKLRAAISQAARPVVVCVAKVTADGVGVPREWK